MNESQVSPTTQYADDVLHLEDEPESPAVAPLRPETAAQPSNWPAHRVVALVTGTLLTLVGLVFLGAGGTGIWADLTQREAGYATTDEHRFSTAGSALATERTELGSAGTSWLYSPGLLGKIRIRITPASPDQEMFVGIGPSAEVDRYLAGANHTVITDFWSEKMQARSGDAPASAPGTQDFWVASTSGPGAQKLTWEPIDGSWTVVVMNADGQPGIDVRADLGAQVPALLWIALGVLAAGAVFGVGGALLITGVFRRRGTAPSSATARGIA